jgi:hypothetical protein
MPDVDTDDLAELIKVCDADLGDPNLWFTPDGYPIRWPCASSTRSTSPVRATPQW